MAKAQQTSSKPTRKLWTTALGTIVTAIVITAAGLDLGAETTVMVSTLVGSIIGYFVPPAIQDQIQEIYEDATGAGTAAVLLALMLPASLATHAITPADLTGPAYSGETVTEMLTNQTHAGGDVSLLRHRPLYEPADA